MTNEQRELNKKVLDRIANDPSFREEILDDPKGALERAGFALELGADDDVSGYGVFPTTGITCNPAYTKPKPGLAGGGGGSGVTTALTCTDPQQNFTSMADKKPTTSSGGGGTGDATPHKPINS